MKAVRLAEGVHGLTLAQYTETRLPPGAFTDGEIVDRSAVVEALMTAATTTGIFSASVALPEPKAYLFETTAQGPHKEDWRIAIEQRLDELVPLPPEETDFDIIDIGRGAENDTPIMGVGFARRIVDDTLSVLDEAGIEVRALEGETFAMARALLQVAD